MSVAIAPSVVNYCLIKYWESKIEKLRAAFYPNGRFLAVLGNSDFVEKALAVAGEDYDRRMRLKASGIDLEIVMDVVSAQFGVSTEELCSPSRRQQICQARALISYLAVKEFRITGADMASRLNVDRSSVSHAIKRVQNDTELKNTSNALLRRLHPGD